MSMSQTAYSELTGLDEELTAGLHACAVTEYIERHVDGYGLVSGDGQKVRVYRVVSNRVELKLVHNCQIALAIDIEVNDVAVGSVSQSLEIPCVNREKNILDAVSVKYAGYMSLSSDALDR